MIQTKLETKELNIVVGAYHLISPMCDVKSSLSENKM